MYVTLSEKKILLCVYFLKMNHGSEQWPRNSTKVEEKYAVVYFLKCLICSVSSQQKLEK